MREKKEKKTKKKKKRGKNGCLSAQLILLFRITRSFAGGTVVVFQQLLSLRYDSTLGFGAQGKKKQKRFISIFLAVVGEWHHKIKRYL